MAFSHDLPPDARLFPLQKNSKRPAIKDWPRLATADPDTLDKWFGDTFKGHNVAVATGQGLMVLDVDTKNGRGGQESLDLLDAMGLPPSYRVKTPSGGVHIYLKADEPISNSVDALEGFPGIDVRGENGYVAAPPSTIDGVPYEATFCDELEPAPEWVVELCRRKRHKKADTDQPVVELDTDEAKRRAVAYLVANAPQAISGEAGNDTTFKVAARLRDYGLSEPIALELLADHWNNLNEPPWDYEDLERITENAFRYASAEWGGASGLRDFEPVEILEPVKKAFELPIERFGEAADTALTHRADMLIKGLLGENTMVVLYGPSGVRKTFAALDLAFHIAAGHVWNDLATRQGAVLYIAAEGGFGIRRRIAALKKKHGLDVPFYLVVFPLNLFDDAKHLKALYAAIDKVGQEAAVPVKLVVLDTLARVMAGGDENSAQDMSIFVQACDAIRHRTKATTMIVHHSGKDVAKGARGSSALRAATDTELEVSGEQGSKVSTLKVTKQRDMEELGPFRFKIEDLELGIAPDGERISGGVVNWIKESDFGPIELSPEDRETLEAFKLAAVGLCIGSEERWEDQIVSTQEIADVMNETREARGQKRLQLRSVQIRVEKVRQAGHFVLAERSDLEKNMKAYKFVQNEIQNEK
jgi:hypothetical protein